MAIIVELIGGLGNQMFQYAAGRALSNRLDLPLKLDISRLKNDKLRSYRLHHLSIKEEFATAQDLESYNEPETQVERIYYRVKSFVLPWHLKQVIHERNSGYDEDFTKIRNDCLLKGYWQSENYFKTIEKVIRNEFCVNKKPDGINAELLSNINLCTSVSMHIRRGDYVTNPVTNKVHGFLGKGYYERAIKFFESNLSEPVFFVFSDDIDWAREHIRTNYPLVFVDHNGERKDYEDLRLMKNCKYHIIANSSFSWWGAWLGEYHNKEVIAPKKWFTPKEMERRGNIDIVPERWMFI
jgi:hypothetical protein